MSEKHKKEETFWCFGQYGQAVSVLYAYDNHIYVFTLNLQNVSDVCVCV